MFIDVNNRFARLQASDIWLFNITIFFSRIFIDVQMIVMVQLLLECSMSNGFSRRKKRRIKRNAIDVSDISL